MSVDKEFEKKAITQALQQRAGMPEGVSMKLSEFNEKQSDWFAWCPKCMLKLQGTPAELRAHRCGQ